MPPSRAKRFENVTVALVAMLMTSLAQPTDDDQSATDCDAHVTERLRDVTDQLTSLRHDVMSALPCDGSVSSNMAQLRSDMSAVRHAVESLHNGRRPPAANHSSPAGMLSTSAWYFRADEVIASLCLTSVSKITQ